MSIKSDDKVKSAVANMVATLMSHEKEWDAKTAAFKTIEIMDEFGMLKVDNHISNESQDLVPAIPVEESVHDNYIVCLEDGKRFKMMKRHLREQYGMTPDQYRNKWGLPSDYPMTAPGYSKFKAYHAKTNGLGRYDRELIVGI